MANKIIKSLNLFSIILVFASIAFTQQVLGPVQLDVPPFEKDKDGKLSVIEYGVELNSFTHKRISLKNFKKENMIIFYFSATCAHCKKAFPQVKNLYAGLEKKGIKMAVVAISGNKEPDIAKFITDFGVDVPVFHDKSRKFGKLYGSGNVPLIMLVNKKGNIIKFKHFKKNVTIDEISFAFADKSKF